jgi:hypothetical protein
MRQIRCDLHGVEDVAKLAVQPMSVGGGSGYDDLR